MPIFDIPERKRWIARVTGDKTAKAIEHQFITNAFYYPKQNITVLELSAHDYDQARYILEHKLSPVIIDTIERLD